MTTLSVCLIFKNEEKHLPRMLQSIDKVADEILAADTGSTDRSAEILAANPKVKLFSFPWTEDFSQARNATLAQATGDWILVIDADEALRTETELKALLENPQHDAYYINIHNHQPLRDHRIDQRNRLGHL